MESIPIKSVCGYCGVGCGVSYESTILKGDKHYPINKGNLCAKGSSELVSLQSSNRLLTPQIRSTIHEAYGESSWEESIAVIAQKIKVTNPKKVGFYLSGQMLTEDYYIANKLGKGFIGTNSVDTNSRTCMSSAVVGYKKSIGADFVPLRMDDIFKANLLILAGANTAEAHVVFHAQIKKAHKAGLKVVVVDPRHTETAKMADIHLPIKVGSDIDFFNLVSKRVIDEGLYSKAFVAEQLNNFNELKEGLSGLNQEEMLLETGLSHERFERFWTLYKESENIITAWTMGLNQSVQGVDKNLALINTHLLTGKIFKAGNGPLSLTGQPNAMGGREVGGLATMLAVHLGFDKDSIEKVSKFWKTDKIDSSVGVTATKMLEADLEVLIICHTDPIYHLPNRHKVEAQMAKIPLVVEINAYENSESSNFAHIRLPASPWGEKEGVQTNLDRSMTKQTILKAPLGEAKADWKIFQALAQALGYKDAFNFKNAQEVFEEYQAMTKLNSYMDIADTNYKELDNNPFVWGEKIKHFLTSDGKGNLFFVQNQHLSEATSTTYPFLLLTGRTRDQWHSGTKSLTPRKLLKYKGLDFCEIHPYDASRLGLREDEVVWVASKRGKIQAKVCITTDVQEGTIFIPISHRGINYLTHDLLDSLSQEPDYNHSAVKIERVEDARE